MARADGDMDGNPTACSSLRLRAACRQALVEARTALTAAAMRLVRVTAALRNSPKPTEDHRLALRQALRAASICRANVERLERFREDLDLAGTAFEALVPIPSPLRDILLPYLPDALDPMLREMRRHPDLGIDPDDLLQLLKAAERSAEPARV